MATALAFTQVSKRFVLQHERAQSFQDRFVQLFRQRSTDEEFWVLRDITFQIEDGQTLGIIGRNGAGKSTMLKLATGILAPTSGQIDRRRRTYAMLELGAGFHPELSGRDNIYLSGSIHGLPRSTMRRLFDRIVAFAELERFIDTPVKHYSSGMYMRLGFAIAIHMQPELLIIDEILAVGDAAFRRKCTEALWDLKRQSVTMLFVSHNEDAVYQFCDQAMLLASGRLVTIGPVDEVIATYTRLSEAQTGQSPAGTAERGRILALATLDQRGRETLSLQPDEPWAIEVVVAVPSGTGTISGEVTVQTDTGSPLVAARLDEATLQPGPTLRYLRAYLDPLPLSAGRLRLGAQLTLPASDGRLHYAAYDSPTSIMIDGQTVGPLLHLPYRWQEHTNAAHPRALTAGATETTPPAPAPYRPISQAPLSPPLASPGRPDPPAATTALTSRYLVEGYTGGTFSTYLTLANPAVEPITVALTAHATTPASASDQLAVAVPAGGSRTLALAEHFGSGREFALTLQSARPFYAERAVFFERYPATGGLTYEQTGRSTLRNIRSGHLSAASETTAPTWHFAEGYTGPGFEPYLLLFNPTTTDTTIELTYYLPDGERLSRRLDLASGQRLTVPAHGAAERGGIGFGHAFSVILRSTTDCLFVAERVVYFSFHEVPGAALAVSGATVTLGATAPATRWAFADGSTETDCEEYLTLLNPHAQTGTAQLTYYFADAEPLTRSVPLPAGRRVTVFVHHEQSVDNPGGLGRGWRHALLLSSDLPIVAERPRYFRYPGLPGAPVEGGSTTLGATALLQTGDQVIFVDSSTSEEFHHYLVGLNPGDAPAQLTITYLVAGHVPLRRTLTLPPRRQTSVAVHQADDPSGAGLGRDLEATILVAVDQAAAPGVLVERTTYFRYGQQATGGAATFGTRLRRPATSLGPFAYVAEPASGGDPAIDR